MKTFPLYVAAVVLVTPLISSAVWSAPPVAKPSPHTNGAKRSGGHGSAQSAVASKTVHFATVAKSAAAVKNALDAHDQAKAHTQVGKASAFKGTVSKVFETHSVVILNFDPDFHKALTAVVKKADFAKFPPLRSLLGKQILVSGKFVDFHGKAEIELTGPGQLKLVQ